MDGDWRSMDRATLSAAYDNGAAVADSAGHLARWRALSTVVRSEQPSTLDLAYGPRARNAMDIFACGRPDAPLFVFLHGGYWMRNGKEAFACMALGPLALGLDVATVGYTLAPEVDLAGIVDEIRTALRLLRAGHPARRLIVSGWSAGGHLAALAAGWPEVDAALCISGIYDLAPLRGTAMNDTLKLGGDDVDRLSPQRVLPGAAKPTVIAYGAAELPELRRQSRDYAAALAGAGQVAMLMPVDGADHFSVLDGLIDPTGPLAKAALALAMECPC